ncbi:MAG: hypothetical protein V9H26_26590 [Verrucomicrobiota bacterium]
MNLFDEVGSRDLDGFDQAFGLFLDLDWFEGFFLLDLGGGIQMRLAIFALAMFMRVGRSGAPSGGKPAATFSARSISP